MIEPQKTYYPNLKQAIRLVVRAILISIPIGIPFFIAMDFVRTLADKSNPSVNSLFYLIIYTLPILIVCYLGLKRIRHINSINYTLKFTKIPFTTSILLFILTFPIIIVTEPFSLIIPMPDFFKEILADSIKPNIFSFLMIVVAAPILEEVLFRGIILDGLLKNYTPKKAIIWSAIIFGVAHLNPWQSISAGLFGLFAGWTYWKTKSLIPGILIHFTNNLFGFIILTSTSLRTDSIIELINNNILYSLLFVVSLTILLLGYKKINNDFKTPSQNQF